RGHLQNDTCEIRSQDFGRRELGPQRKVVFGEQANADPLAFASGAAFTLIRARLRDLLDRQALHFTAHTVSADARETRIDDVPNAGDGERGFRDVRRKHDAARTMLLEDALLIAR